MILHNPKARWWSTWMWLRPFWWFLGRDVSYLTLLDVSKGCEMFWLCIPYTVLRCNYSWLSFMTHYKYSLWFCFLYLEIIYIKSRGATRQLSLVIVLRKVMERFRRLMKNISLSKKWSSSTQFGCISLGFGDESTCQSNVVWIVSFQNNWIVCMFDPRKSLVKFGWPAPLRKAIVRVNSKELPKGRSSSSARKGTGYITKVREGVGTVQMSG